MSSNNPLALKPGYLNWWQSLILAFACTLAGVIAAVAAGTGMTAGVAGAPASWVMDLLKLVPHALMLFGLMADAITYDGVYWTSTIVGLSAMPLHSTLESVMGSLVSLFEKIKGGISFSGTGTITTLKGEQTIHTGPNGGMRGGSDFTGCNIMGGGIEPGHRTAQSLVVTASIIVYFFLDLWLNRGMINALGVMVMGIVLMGGQAFAISKVCFDDANPPLSVTAGVLYALLYGVVIGGAYYSFFQAYYPMYLPSTVIPLSNTISATTDTGFVYVPGIGLVSSSSPAGQQAISQGTALSPDEMSQALETTGTVGTGAPGKASTCS